MRHQLPSLLFLILITALIAVVAGLLAMHARGDMYQQPKFVEVK